MNYNDLLSSKHLYTELEPDIFNKLNELFNLYCPVINENINATQPSKKNKKDLSVIVKEILNKLTEHNFHQLMIEFINNVGQVNEHSFDVIQENIYNKCMDDIEFVYVYIKFIRVLNNIYNSVQNYNIRKFVELTCQNILTNSHENKRITAMKIYIEMLNQKIVTDIMTDKLVASSYSCTDIYYWINNTNIKLSLEQKQFVKTRVANKELSKRENIIIQELLIL